MSNIFNEPDLKVERHLIRSVTVNITASTTQAQGEGLLIADLNHVTVVANNNDTVTLPVSVGGMAITIFNLGANTLQIFPNTGAQIDAGGANNSTTLAAANRQIFRSVSAADWFTIL